MTAGWLKRQETPAGCAGWVSVGHPCGGYHMLYIDTDYPLAEQVIRDSTLFALYLNVVENMSANSLNMLISALPRCASRTGELRSTSQHIQQAFLAGKKRLLDVLAG